MLASFSKLFTADTTSSHARTEYETTTTLETSLDYRSVPTSDTDLDDESTTSSSQTSIKSE